MDIFPMHVFLFMLEFICLLFVGSRLWDCRGVDVFSSGGWTSVLFWLPISCIVRVYISHGTHAHVLCAYYTRYRAHV